jgi:hypothetical protein
MHETLGKMPSMAKPRFNYRDRKHRVAKRLEIQSKEDRGILRDDETVILSWWWYGHICTGLSKCTLSKLIELSY